MAATAFAFRSPVAIIAIASDRSIVPIPIDSASSKSARILCSRRVEQRYSVGSRAQHLTRFVESDVAVHANPEQQQA
jgi:hypothetical protein